MKPKIRTLIELAVSEGVIYGYKSAYKHNDDPSDGEVAQRITDEVMNMFDIYFDFE